jgi:hypothetical protein
MNKATPLIKFSECFGINPNSIKSENTTESYFIEKGINVDDFKRLMIKNDLDDYTFILLYYIIEIYLSDKVDEAINSHIQSDNERVIARQYEIDLTKTLLFLLDDKTLNMSVTFNKSRSSVTIQNELIVKQLANKLYVEFKKHDFHKVALTYQEAKAEMLLNEKFKNCVYRKINNGSPEEPDIIEVEFDVAIDHYAENSKKEMEITVDFLTHKLKTLTNKGKKKGAKIKNSRLADLCEDLSFLKRIDKYLNQTETDYICDIPLTNDDCRFIYGCLVFFSITEYNTTTITKTLHENYIRTILKQKKRESWIEEDMYGARLFNIHDLRSKLHQ